MASKYFAIIDDKCQGPFNLDELKGVGVGPNTYVWCKTMSDWQPALEVGEISDYFRQSLRKTTERQAPLDNLEKDNGEDNYFNRFFARYGVEFSKMEESEDMDIPPQTSIVAAVLMTLFCFPITGFVGIYYTIKSRKEWANAVRSESDSSQCLYTSEERREFKMYAHHYARMAKMWIGITFFMGFILYAIISKYSN